MGNQFLKREQNVKLVEQSRNTDTELVVKLPRLLEHNMASASALRQSFLIMSKNVYKL